MGVVSMIIFIVSIVLTPYLLGLIDENYFSELKRRRLIIQNFGHLLIIILKNVFGFVLLITGIIMLITPGQGIIAILLGLFLMEFPGKYQLELKLIAHNPTFKALNWLRNKVGKPPFKR